MVQIKQYQVEKQYGLSPLEIQCKRCNRVLRCVESKVRGYGLSCYKKEMKEKLEKSTVSLSHFFKAFKKVQKFKKEEGLDIIRSPQNIDGKTKT